MIELRESRAEELRDFHAMERDADTHAYILPYSLRRLAVPFFTVQVIVILR